MPGRRLARGVLVLVVASWATIATAAPTGQSVPPDGIARLLAQIERALLTADPDQYLALLTPEADREAARAVAASLVGGRPLRIAVREQDRAPLNTAKSRLIVNVFADFGLEGRVATWSMDVRRSAGEPDAWQVAEQHVITNLTGLYRVALNTTKIYDARGVSVDAEDFDLRMTDGSVFAIEAAGRVTGLVLVGKGNVTFRPAPATEQGQMRIFAGAPELRTAIDGAFIRLNPGDVAAHVKGLDRQQAHQRDVRRAQDVFREYNGRSFALDLADLSSDIWSLLPNPGDALIEMFTRRFGTLTYTRSQDDPEDISLFDRKARHNIAAYASRERLATRGPFYDEDAAADYDVIDYDVDVRMLPEKGTIAGRARMTVEVRADSLSHLSVRLSDGLRVQAAVADGLGRVLALRVPNRNSIIVTLPSVVVRGSRIALTFDYAGSLAAQRGESDSAALGDGRSRQDSEERISVPIQDSYLYSNKTYWYPQSPVSDYATGTLKIAVPPRFTVVATGELMPAGSDQAAPPEDNGLRQFAFRASKPVRYLACIISPMVQVKSDPVRMPAVANAAVPVGEKPVPTGGQLQLTVKTNPRERLEGRNLAALAADIMQFYAGLVGDCPYPTLDLALIEHELPGGHSPAYLAVINHPVSNGTLTWRNDPATIENFPEYFVAHELAHQWWGQAVGWKNYHEQWLSEGFAQYFSALYAEHVHGSELLQDILRGWQRWAEQKSDQGPVYLGYRVGHIKGDARVFRAVVYNKSATVLHMLRRLIGDDAFFAGLRRFYGEFRFRKAGTDDLQRALEAESGVSLQRFFDRWIYGDTLPRLRAAARTEAVNGRRELVVTVEQAGEVFDAPVVLTLGYSDRPAADVTVKLREAQQEFRIPLAGTLRRLDLNRVDGVPVANLTFNSQASSRAEARPQPRASVSR